MNPSIILDILLSQNNGNIFVFDKTCPLSLIKEAILRGFQVQRASETDLDYIYQNQNCGRGERNGGGSSRFKEREGWGYSEGTSFGYGFEGDSEFLPPPNYGNGKFHENGIIVFRNLRRSILNEDLYCLKQTILF